LEVEVRGIRDVLGRPANAAIGDDGSGMMATLSRLAEAQRATSKRVAAIVTAAGVALEVLRWALPAPSEARPVVRSLPFVAPAPTVTP
jgi:hypothetical protein